MAVYKFRVGDLAITKFKKKVQIIQRRKNVREQRVDYRVVYYPHGNRPRWIQEKSLRRPTTLFLNNKKLNVSIM